MDAKDPQQLLNTPPEGSEQNILIKRFGNHVVFFTTWNWNGIRNCQKYINFQKSTMAKRSTRQIEILPGNTMIEVIAIAPGKQPIKKEMTINDANALKKKKGWKYHRFQLGFSQFINLKTD